MSKQNTYKIEKRIPMPTTKPISRTARIRKTLARMEVGDSFAIPCRDWGNASMPRYVVPYREARDARIKIATQITASAVRVWRVK